MIQARLMLNNKQNYTGLSPSWQTGAFCGEVVFTTGMTGYIETLTDPSYAGQIIVFTYPLIGNYSVPDKKFWESNKIYAAGVVVSEACEHPDSAKNSSTLLAWLKEQNVPIITGVDTRALTKYLREQGTTPGIITSDQSGDHKFSDPNELNLVGKVSTKKIKNFGRGEKKIIAVDCGMKTNLLRSLLEFPLSIKVVPHDYDYSQENFDAVFISNGPGDPTKCARTIEILQRAMKKKKPIFGVCLGMQIMALAAGAKTHKLPYGHRGQNQPCMDMTTKHCYITSQNHGYVADPNSLPQDWSVYFKNLNDGSVEGIKHKTLPFFSVQFHPEAAPGPTDTAWLFKKLYDLV